MFPAGALPQENYIKRTKQLLEAGQLPVKQDIALFLLNPSPLDESYKMWIIIFRGKMVMQKMNIDQTS